MAAVHVARHLQNAERRTPAEKEPKMEETVGPTSWVPSVSSHGVVWRSPKFRTRYDS